MKINNIDTKDISVVVQGAIDKKNTPICLKSIRKYLPDAEIILSTWEGSDVNKLDYDILVLNKDPGNCICDEVYKTYNNVNRQIVSTKNGLKQATKKYAIKIRNDMEITGNNFLNYFEKFDKYEEEYKVFKSRIITLTLYSRVKFFDNENEYNIPFYVSDWFSFGFSEDVKKFWDIEIVKNFEEYNKYFLNAPDSIKKKMPFKTLNSRFAMEQTICYGFIKKNKLFNDIEFKDITDTDNKKLIDTSLHFLINNFVFLNVKYSNIINLKWRSISENEYTMHSNDKAGFIFYDNFVNLYNEFCVKKSDKKITFLIPTYPPHFKYAKDLLTSFYKNNLDKQADLFFIFTDEKEKVEFGECYSYIILPKELRVFENKGIINIKKFYGISQLKDRYNYIIILDDESKFIKNINLEKLCNNYFKNKILYGNNCSDPCNCASIVHSRLDAIFPNNNIDKNLYLWFNQLCIYKSDTIDDFFNKINYKEIIKKISYHDFDYYIYMYYLILYQGFSIVDMRAECDYGFCETVERYKLLDGYKKLNLNLSTQYMYKLLKNKNLFVLIHSDMCDDIMSKELKVQKSVQKFKKHWKNFFQPLEKTVKRFFKWFGEFFAVLFYGVKIVLKFLCNCWRLF